MQTKHANARGAMLHVARNLFSLSILVLLMSNTSWASLWTIDYSTSAQTQVEQQFELVQNKNYQLDNSGMSDLLSMAPMENTTTSPVIISLPSPSGAIQDYYVEEFDMMEPALSAKYPGIKTYTVTRADNPYLKGKVCFSHLGLIGYVQSERGEFSIRPSDPINASAHTTFYADDNLEDQLNFECPELITPSEQNILPPGTEMSAATARGDSLRIFRAVVAIQGEVWQAWGFVTKADAMAQVTGFMASVNAIYERDMSVRFTLVANTDTLFYSDTTTDPYKSAPGLLDDHNLNAPINQIMSDSLIGSANYDVSMVCVQGGCCAASGGVCSATGKARNTTRLNGVRVTCHEVGHQFGAGHTWNGCGGVTISGQYRPATAHEPGSGTTVMAYPGICGIDNISNTGNTSFFSIQSYIEIQAYIDGLSCQTQTATGNSPPVITISTTNNIKIPHNTPFRLDGTATDADPGDSLSYSWEQHNICGIHTNLGIDTADCPIIRIYNPSDNGTRYIPAFENILNGINDPAELLPTGDKSMDFKLYVRDNSTGMDYENVHIDALAGAGPFDVTSQTTCTSYTAGAPLTVTWDVANTDDPSGVNCQLVNIKLSDDGGETFTTMVANTANDGSETFNLPTACGSNYRIMVEAADNIFWDVNEATFTIAPATPAVVTNNCIDMDGDNDIIRVNNTLGNFGTGEYTIEFWMKRDAPPTENEVVMSKREICGGSPDFWQIHIWTSGAIGIESSGSGTLINTGINMCDGNWHHFAVRRDAAGNTYLRYDGANNWQTSAFSSHDYNNSADFLIGETICNMKAFDGQLDEVRIWDHFRTNDEIAEAMNCQLIGNESGLTAYYDFNIDACENCSFEMEDLSTNANDATLENFSLNGSSSNYVAATNGVDHPCNHTHPFFSNVYPSSCVALTGGASQTVTWNNSNTSGVNINCCSTVDIEITDDGGATSTVLISGTANDGSESVTLPTLCGSNYEFIIRSSEYDSLYALSDAKFSIPSSPLPTVGNNALNFDGSDDIITSNNTLGNFGTGEYTVEFWMRRSGLPSAQEIVLSKRDACSASPDFWEVFIRTDGTMGIESNGISMWNPGVNVCDGSWHHFAVRRDAIGNTYVRYDGGNNWQTGSFSAHNYAGTSNFKIANGVCGQKAFEGDLDELRIWNVFRDNDQIQETMNCQLIGNETGLAAYYPMNQDACEACANILYDKTTNGNDGQLEGFALTGAASNFVPATNGVDDPCNHTHPFFSNVYPSSCVALTGGSSQTVTWSNSNTSGVNINCCSTVDIEITNDGGATSTVLISGTANDGSESVTLPTLCGSNYEFIIRSSEYDSLYALSDAKFSIPSSPLPTVGNNALNFDGSDDIITFNNTLGNFGTGEYTVEFWIRRSGLPSAQEIVLSKRDVCSASPDFWEIFIRTDGTMGIESNGIGMWNPGVNVCDGSWHHFAVRRDAIGNTYVRYDGGNNWQTGSFAAHNYAGTDNFKIANGVCGQKAFEGDLDELRIWNVFRDNDQIQETMNCQLIGNETGLAAYYPMNQDACEACASTLYDKSTNSNDGTMEGFALTGSSSNFLAATNGVDDPCPTHPFISNVSPTTCVGYTAGSTQTITWTTSNTTGININCCSTVDILMSDDGGATYGTTLLSGTVNDGTEDVTIPSTCGANYRIRVVSSDHSTLYGESEIFSVPSDPAPAVTNKALNLDGVDDIGTINSTLGNFGTGEYTIEFWMRRSGAPASNEIILSKRDVCGASPDFWEVFVRTDGTMGIESSGFGFWNSSVDVCDGNWHHFAVRRDGAGDTYLRYDGANNWQTNFFASHNYAGATDFKIANGVCGQKAFEGDLDELRIWNVFRDNTQIQETMNCQLIGNEAGLAAYYPMNQDQCESCPRILLDKTANGNDGTLSGFDMSGAASNFVAATNGVDDPCPTHDFFTVTSPNTCVDVTAGGTTTVTWNTNNTTGINIECCDEVDILLSDDGGTTFPTTLISNTTNDGSELVSIPAGCSPQGRIRVVSSDYSTILDESDIDFSLINNFPYVGNHQLSTDGSGQQVDFNSTLGNFGTGDFTIEFKIRTSHAGPSSMMLLTKRPVCGHENFWNLMVRDNGFLRFESDETAGGLNYSTVTSTTAINDGQWHHAAVVRSGTTITWYIDGVAAGSGTGAANLNNATVLSMGGGPCSPNPLNLDVEELRIWSVARTLGDLNANANCDISPSSTGLTAYYTMNRENCETCANLYLLEDQTANSHDGTMTGFDYSTGTNGFYPFDNDPGTCDPTATPVIMTQGTYVAYSEFTDGGGWTHYCDCNGSPLISIQKGTSGVDIPTGAVSVNVKSPMVEYFDLGESFNENILGSAIMSRSWDVQPNVQPNQKIKVRYYFSNAEFYLINDSIHANGQDTLTAASDMWFYKVLNSGLGPHPDLMNLSLSDVVIIDTPVVTIDTSIINQFVFTDNGTNLVAEIAVASFSGGGGGGTPSGGTPLLIELLSFDAIAQDKAVRLDWTTAMEVDNVGFWVEHSLDGRNWSSLTFIDGAGNSLEPIHYNYLHSSPEIGLNYYRIKDLDEDGTSNYSHVEVVNFKSDVFEVVLFPSPSVETDIVYLSHTGSETFTASVTSISGQQIAFYPALDENTTALEFPYKLSAGVYNITFEYGDKKVIRRLVIQ